MQDRAVRLREIAVARDALQLTPGLATGMPVGADIPPGEPAMIRAIRIGTEVRWSIDSASASSGEGEERRWRTGGFGTRIGTLLTSVTERFVDEASEGFRRFGAGSSGLVRREGPVRCGPGMVGPPDMDNEEAYYESDQ
jgi:hypothetical protein